MARHDWRPMVAALPPCVLLRVDWRSLPLRNTWAPAGQLPGWDDVSWALRWLAREQPQVRATTAPAPTPALAPTPPPPPDLGPAHVRVPLAAKTSCTRHRGGDRLTDAAAGRRCQGSTQPYHAPRSFDPHPPPAHVPTCPVLPPPSPRLTLALPPLAPLSALLLPGPLS